MSEHLLTNRTHFLAFPREMPAPFAALLRESEVFPPFQLRKHSRPGVHLFFNARVVRRASDVRRVLPAVTARRTTLLLRPSRV